MEVAAASNSMNRDRLNTVKNLLAQKLDQPVELKVKIIPVEIISMKQ